MRASHLRPALWVGLLLGSVPLATAPADEPGCGPDCGTPTVRFAIHEGIPEPWKGELPQGEPAETFEAPALGLVRLPIKYSARGIAVDRAVPLALHARVELTAPAGPHRLILRARNSARLIVDGAVLAETKPLKPNASGHEPVPPAVIPEDPRWRALAAGEQERIVAWESDGKPHTLELWAIVGGKRLRPETGELSVSLVAPGGVPVLVGSGGAIRLTNDDWEAFAAAEHRRLDAWNTRRRREAAAGEAPYWEARHALARREALAQPDPAPGVAPEALIDHFIDARLAEAGAEPAPPADDAAFFRRLALDTIGLIPEPDEVEAFLADPRPDKRARAVDARLADPRWADGWMGYWQDVLAENPGILKPTLNNTGPFRAFLHEALADNLPLDRFVTELARMEGSKLGGGPAGFAMASENDAPMAAKAHILAKAFLAAEMKCARCHDSPSHPYDQADLFGLAALLDGKPQAIPATSTVRRQPGGRTPAVSVSLEAGDKVEPEWNLVEIGPASLPDGMLPADASGRDRLAALITSPRNSRFAPVAVNRLWKRYLGVGIVEPVDDWDADAEPSHPELLAALAREFMAHGYDLKHVARLILNSRAYQRSVVAELADSPAGSAGKRLFASPARRRMSAEQLLDSLFAAAGKGFDAEELNLDPDGRRPASEFVNLGVPRRAWEFVAASNERDRPALTLPVTQNLVDVLQTFGWRASRSDPITVREEATTPIQPALLANSIVTGRVTRLSDDSAFTAIGLADQPAEALVRDVYLRVLSRTPTDREVERVISYLSSSHANRVVPGAEPLPKSRRDHSRKVSWSNHLHPEATVIQLEMEKAARAGDPPTPRLTPAFRERMEDVVWALVNSPEFLFLP